VTFIQRIKTPFTEEPPDEQVPYEPGMRRIGELLQERREELGLDLNEIGTMLRIKPGYLAALEQGRANQLPGPAYAIGFIRAYAEFLGFDSAQVLARFKAEAAGVTARPDLSLPVPLGERSLPGGTLVLVALILALCGYGFWYYLSTEQRDRPARVASVPASLQVKPVLVAPSSAPAADSGPASSDSLVPPPRPATTPAASAASAQPIGPTIQPIPVAAQPAPAASPAVASSSVAGVQASAPPVAADRAARLAAVAPTPDGATRTASGPQPAAAPAAQAPGQKIAIRAVSDCWIQVRAADQSIVFSRVLKSGEVYMVPARTGLSLRTGNAGALQIAVDGKNVPSIGGVGTLRRDVALDPAELAGGTAVRG
jgi:cytoskeleton protein RodZ